MKIRAFLREESGAVTADYVVLLSTVVILGLATVGTVGRGVLSAADDIASSIGNTTLLSFTAEAGSDSGGTAGDTGSDDTTDGGSADSSGGDGDADDSSSDSTGSTGSGNPGNDKDVGRAGENPNGQGGWGGGSHGRAD